MVYNFVVAFILLAVAYDFDVIFYGTVIAVTAAFLWGHSNTISVDVTKSVR